MNAIPDVTEILQRISGIQREFRSISGMRDRISREIRDEIDESLPDFARVLTRKKARTDHELGKTIRRVSREEGVDESLIRAVIEVESDFDPEAVSSEGARGLMQLMPETARELDVDPDQPKENIRGGARYLGRLIDRFGRLDQALAAYNAGPGVVKQWDGIPPYDETRSYVKRVLESFRKLKQENR